MAYKNRMLLNRFWENFADPELIKSIEIFADAEIIIQYPDELQH